LSTYPMTAQTAGLEIGWLDCVIERGSPLALASNTPASCTFRPTGGSDETYVGNIAKIGPQIGVSDLKLLQWKVIAINRDAYQPGSLSGDYYGVSAEAAVAVGGGAHVLGGGLGGNFVLQPVSVQEQAGVNAAASVTRFSLSQG
jgi:hypothetical protein